MKITTTQLVCAAFLGSLLLTLAIGYDVIPSKIAGFEVAKWLHAWLIGISALPAMGAIAALMGKRLVIRIENRKG